MKELTNNLVVVANSYSVLIDNNAEKEDEISSQSTGFPYINLYDRRRKKYKDKIEDLSSRCSPRKGGGNSKPPSHDK